MSTGLPAVRYSGTVACHVGETAAASDAPGRGVFLQTHVVLAETTPDTYIITGGPIVGYKDGVGLCAKSPTVTFLFTIDRQQDVTSTESSRNVVIRAVGSGSTLVELHFDNMVDYWSFVQQYAAARVRAHKRSVADRKHQEELFQDILSSFPTLSTEDVLDVALQQSDTK
ncbi:hypothetical protein C8Q79DRAFT_1006483 [Trametes meyenii]|nr:hypothetical protein C8Q79DRAFT_1006483 [Trametes meyenii]